MKLIVLFLQWFAIYYIDKTRSPAHTNHEVINVNNNLYKDEGAPLNNNFMDNNDAPVGFKMTLAQNMDALNKFTALPKAQQQALVNGARQITNPEEMQVYVMQVLQGG